MTRWLYRRLTVWFGFRAKQDAAGWYSEVDWTDALLFLFASPTPKREILRLPLNSQRNWGAVFWHQWMTWDEEAGEADLAMEVVAKLGLEGWELAGIQLGLVGGSTTNWPSSYIFFKKPAE